MYVCSRKPLMIMIFRQVSKQGHKATQALPPWVISTGLLEIRAICCIWTGRKSENFTDTKDISMLEPGISKLKLSIT